MNKQIELPYGYKWYTGLIMSRSMTDSYNRLTRSIVRAESEGMQSHAEDLKQMRFQLGNGVVYNVKQH